MNNVAYFEIQATQPERAMAFYGTVFGWAFVPQAGMDYWRIETSGISGGLLARPAGVPPPQSGTNAYVCSVQVEDFDAVAERILHNGGRVALEKFRVPGRCWQGYFLDPEKNTFGIFEIDEDAV